MLSVAKNYDGLCFELRSSFYSQLNTSLKSDLDVLSAEIKSIVVSGNQIDLQTSKVLPKVFDLRVNALRWLLSNVEFDFEEVFRTVIPHIEELKSNKKLESLVENILFALRCNQRVIESVLNSDFSHSVSTGISEIKQIPKITYEVLITSLAISYPDGETVQQMINWINSSLIIEFVMLAASVIHSEHLDIPERAVNQLSFIIADAAQEYYAISSELGFVKTNYSRVNSTNLNFDENFVKEEKAFADFGLDEFSTNLLNE